MIFCSVECTRHDLGTVKALPFIITVNPRQDHKQPSPLWEMRMYMFDEWLAPTTPAIQTVGVMPREMLQGHEEAPSEATQMLIMEKQLHPG